MLHSTNNAQAVTIIIPAYNEEQAIAAVVQDIRSQFAGAASAEIIIVDDGSTDGTAANAAATGAALISHPGNLGYGAALKTGLRAATNDIIVITDADGTYPAKHIDPLVRELERCDMAVGAREGANVHYPAVRRPAKWLLVATAEFLAEKPIPDLNSGLRAFRKGEAMRFLNLYPSGFSFTTTITLAFLSSDLLVRYVPIEYHPRVGRSKIRPLRDTKNLFLTVVRSIFFFNPLRVCFPISVALVIAAIVILVFVRDRHDNVLDSTVAVLLLSAIQVLITGFIADVIARMR